MTPTDIARALNDLLFDPIPDLAEAIDRHFAPGYRQRTDGVWSDRTAFAQHITRLRSVVQSGQVEVHEELRDGLRYADRHTVTITQHNGRTSRTEVYLFGECAPDGRFHRIEETTRLVSGHSEDENLGRIR
ncbi:hypothetical protein [Couchioplanes caeruleus]|uniref:SnoaL-like protein n=2 Tax=Couchioplanes caeruleus TaxID=56438 RepID=A0A1K0FE95_9ACTN|nr:hypothetical protein [Couchioplanes caeruleus]OJF11159.1 hypothetical protein BG844_28025 [Couchioplanes caeruleus subsp. caeruleus]ROP30899.1 hypothetical protein EDD30_3775 [Couchioplanes caeruleus]